MEAEDFASFLASYNEEPCKSLRINPLKKHSAGVPAPDCKTLFGLEPVEWCENGFYYDGSTLPGKHPLHEAGAFYIQEASAMAPVKWLDVRPGMRVLDLCAAPGGKSTEIAELLQNTGFLVANEPDRNRAKILSLNIERLGIRNAFVSNEMPDKLAELFPGFFDRILVDAPCSGEGMFRKNPEAVKEWSEENVSMCAMRQDGILESAAKMLVPGGIMVYSTCTFSKEEDEGSIERFLNREKDFCLISPDSIRNIPDGFVRADIPNGSSGYGIRLFPHKIRGEGHFFAVLKRDGFSPEGGIRSAASGLLKEASQSAKKLFSDFVWEFISVENGIISGKSILHEFGDQLYLADSMMPGIKGLKVLRPGLHLGTLKNKRFEPGHALALFLSPDDAALQAHIPDAETALRYLKGESLSADYLTNADGRGWCIMEFMGMSLGWGKSDGRMLKNHYPKGLRKN